MNQSNIIKLLSDLGHDAYVPDEAERKPGGIRGIIAAQARTGHQEHHVLKCRTCGIWVIIVLQEGSVLYCFEANGMYHTFIGDLPTCSEYVIREIIE